MKNSQDFKNQLYTQFPIQENTIWTKPEHLFFMGSCFSTNISEQFNQHFIDTLSNPFGTIFSPDAIAQCLQHIQNRTLPAIINFQNTQHALLFDTDFQNPNHEALETKIKHRLEEARNYLSKCNTVFITFGSAWVYKHLLSNQLVGNCQKIPQNQFEKIILPIEHIVENLNQIHNSIRAINTQCNIVFTISPVRHLRDGISENILSKSHLIVALQSFISQNSQCHYFPSYEIFNEELRDHRYFQPDLAHPNELAIEYIFKRLIEVYGDETFKEFMDKANALKQLINHKLKTTDPIQISNWQQNLEKKKAEFIYLYPNSAISNQLP
jgi:hypothetical protein